MTKGRTLFLALACYSLPSLATIGQVTPGGIASVTIDSLQWTLVDSTQTATLNRYGKNSDNPVIPEEVVYDGKSYKVVAIASVESQSPLEGVSNVFNSTIKEVSLPRTLKVVGLNAFSGCENLNKLVLPESVDSIGSNAFWNASSLITLHVQAPVAPKNYISSWSSNTLSNSSIAVVYVPNGSGDSYRNADGWKDFVIIDGEGTSVSVDVQTPGELASEILNQADNLSNVNILKISGSLNDDDIYKIYHSMPNLIEIDLSETDLKEMPSSMLSGKKALRKVVLPSSLVSIDESAFSGCSALESINIPDSVSEIKEYTFSQCI